MSDTSTVTVYANKWIGKKPSGSLSALLCSGAGDDVEINNAINRCAAARGGKVTLVGHDFTIDNPILMRTGVTLDFESGDAARVIASASFPSGRGMIELADDYVHATKIMGGYLDGAGRPCHGILYKCDVDETFPGQPLTSPDPQHRISDMLIRSVGSGSVAGYGMLMRGGNLRAGKYRSIRIQNASGCGLWIDKSVDSHYTDLDIGSSAASGITYSASSTAPVGHGIYDGGEQNNLMGCKAWFSRGAGFYIRSIRTRITSCEAQDNYSYGLHLEFGKTTVNGFMADSNGQAEGANSRGRAGVRVQTDFATLTGVQSFDRAQGSHGWKQQYGFEFTSGARYGGVANSLTYGNEVGSVTGTPGTQFTTDIVSGSGSGTAGF